MADIFRHINSRARSIERGSLGRDKAERLAHVKWMFDKHLPEINQAVVRHGKAEKSDPFASRRAASHFKHGIADLDDYNDDPMQSIETVERGGRKVEVSIVQYINRRRP